MTDISKYKNVSLAKETYLKLDKIRKIMYQVPEEDRKELLKYLSTKPYIEVAPLIGMLAQWKKKEKEKKENGQDKPN